MGERSMRIAARKGFISFLSSMNFMNMQQKVSHIYFSNACQQAFDFTFIPLKSAAFWSTTICRSAYSKCIDYLYWYQVTCNYSVLSILLLSNSRWCIKSTKTFILFIFLIAIGPIQNRKGPNAWMKVKKKMDMRNLLV